MNYRRLLRFNLLLVGLVLLFVAVGCWLFAISYRRRFLLFNKHPSLSTLNNETLRKRLLTVNFTKLANELDDFSHKISVNNGLTRKCSKSWPELELFLPLRPNENGLAEFLTLLLPSLALFWPKSQTKLAVITDAEVGEYRLRIFHEKLARAANDSVHQLRIVSSKDRHLGLDGWHRKQWLAFWADNFTTAPYVGFIDGDTVFVTRVTRHDLFADDEPGDRPIVRASYGKPLNSFWGAVPSTTEWAIGRKEPFKCMSYFPVIVKLEHLKLLREHMRLQLGGASFDEGFRKITGYFYSQFNIICAYLWYFHRDEYHWIIRETEPGWSGFVVGQVDWPEEAGITEDLMSRPSPHLAIHWNYEIFRHLPGALKFILATGVCYSLSEDEGRKWQANFCRDVKREETNIFEWQFEGVDYSTVPGVLESHQRRILANNEACAHEWQQKALNALSKMKTVVPIFEQKLYNWQSADIADG